MGKREQNRELGPEFEISGRDVDEWNIDLAKRSCWWAKGSIVCIEEAGGEGVEV